MDDNLNLTAFDPRAIFIAGGDYVFTELGRTVAVGDAVPLMLNSDGLTQLFNPTDYPEDSYLPPALKYWTGQFATGGDLSATLNPYIALAKEQPRRMFLPGSEETVTVKLAVPTGPIQFGYAVDVSWIDPGIPVVDPVTDFPPDANTLEPYEITIDMDEWLDSEQYSEVTVRVYVSDHQGLSTISSVILEAPDIFGGTVECAYIGPVDDDTFEYTGQITNEFGSEPGEYPMLVRTVSLTDDLNLGEVNAWEVMGLKVIYGYINYTEQTPPWLNNGQIYNITEGDCYAVGTDTHLHIYDITDPVDPVWVTGLDGLRMCFTHHLASKDGYIYVANTDALNTTLTIVDVDPVQEAHVVGSHDVSCGAPMTVSIRDNYAWVGCRDCGGDHSISFFDITDPENAYEVGYVDILDCPYAIAFEDGYTYVISDGAGYGLSVYDITIPDQVEYLNTFHIGSLHDIVVDNGYTYTFYNNGEILDITPPDLLIEVKELGALKNNDIAVRDGYLYGTSGEYWDREWVVYDIDPPEDASVVAAIPGLDGGKIALNGDYAYVTDPAIKTCIIDISSPEFPETVGYIYSLDSNLKEIADYDHTLFLARDESSEYGPCDHCEPGNVISVSNASPQTAQILDVLDLEVGSDVIGVYNGYAYAAGYNILYTVDITDPENLALVTETPITGDPSSLIVDWPNLFMATSDGITSIDISSPSSPAVTDHLHCSNVPLYIQIRDGYAYALMHVSEDTSGIGIIDISDPYSLVEVDMVLISGRIMQVGEQFWEYSGFLEMHDEYLYSATYNVVGIYGKYALNVLRIVDPGTLEVVDTLVLDSGHIHDMTIDYPTAYIIGRDNLLTLDLTEPDSPVINGNSEEIIGCYVWKNDSILYVINKGLQNYDLS